MPIIWISMPCCHSFGPLVALSIRSSILVFMRYILPFYSYLYCHGLLPIAVCARDGKCGFSDVHELEQSSNCIRLQVNLLSFGTNLFTCSFIGFNRWLCDLVVNVRWGSRIHRIEFCRFMDISVDFLLFHCTDFIVFQWNFIRFAVVLAQSGTHLCHTNAIFRWVKMCGGSWENGVFLLVSFFLFFLPSYYWSVARMFGQSIWGGRQKICRNISLTAKWAEIKEIAFYSAKFNTCNSCITLHAKAIPHSIFSKSTNPLSDIFI